MGRPATRNHQQDNNEYNVDLNEAFNPHWIKYLPGKTFSLLTCPKRYSINIGGRCSGKSHNIGVNKLLTRIIAEDDHSALVVRKVADTLQDSVYEPIVGRIEEWGLSDDFYFNKTTKHIIYKPNGNDILFKGCENSEKLKSITGRRGRAISIVWIEEATELSEKEFDDIDCCVRRGHPTYDQMVLTLNPISVYHWIKRRFFDRPSKEAFKLLPKNQQDYWRNVQTDISTIDDNPHAPQANIDQLDNLEQRDPGLGRVYRRGLWGDLKGLIFTNWRIGECKERPDATVYGLDFAFSAPTALVRCDFKGNDIYLTEILYEPIDTTEDIMKKMDFKGVPRDAFIFGDSSEPSRIITMQRAGWSGAMLVEKGPDSVRPGIDAMRARQIYYAKESVNIEKEMSTYKWREDKYGNVILPETPVKFNDHAMDAARYGIISYQNTNLGAKERFTPVIGLGATTWQKQQMVAA